MSRCEEHVQHVEHALPAPLERCMRGAQILVAGGLGPQLGKLCSPAFEKFLYVSLRQKEAC